MAEQAKHPFEGYTLYVVMHKGEGRRMANLVRSKNDRTTMSYARYLMSVHLGRRLLKDEHVDHIDDDKLNDVVENFQILTQAENKLKYERANPKQLKRFTCPVCGKEFELEKMRYVCRPNPTCSRKCGGIKSHQTARNNATVSKRASIS